MADHSFFQLSIFAPLVAYGSLSCAARGCGEPVIDAIRDVQEAVDSLRMDARSKRVMIGAHGEVHTLKAAVWMREQLRMIQDACVRGGDVEAAWRVEGLQVNLNQDNSLRVGQ